MSDRFDELLNKVLREESAVEPRAGLERRVMVRVGERSAAASRRWMFAAWAGGLAVAAVVLVVLLPGRHELRAVHHDGLAAGVVGEVPAEARVGADKGFGLEDIPSAAEAALSSDKTTTRLKSRPFKANARVEIARAARAETGSAAAVARDEEARLPKLDVFPSPATADVFPAPVAGGQDTAESLSPKAAEALMALQKEQQEAIQIAAIVIAPLNPER